MKRRIHIEAVSPAIEGGAYAVKRVVGDEITASADILRDGHDAIRAQVRWRDGRMLMSQWQVRPMVPDGNDRWEATLVLTRNTTVHFCIDAWTDAFTTWVDGLRKKAEKGMCLRSEVGEGVELLDCAIDRATGPDCQHLEIALADLRAANTLQAALKAVQDPALADLIDRWLPHPDVVTSATLPITVDRTRAVYSTWYEMFPRSQGQEPGKPCTLRQAAERLPALRSMGFDMVYLPPIHPIGLTQRKGTNDSLAAGPNDPGCPWAIGSAAGGHLAVDPGLGTLSDFDAFVTTAAEQNMEVALDFAIQCSPDHPWVTEHPDWFKHRPDGSIKYAENPPKKYQDVYPLNFDTADHKGLWRALLEVLSFWIGHGVKAFRVDNPHTKPFLFWKWVIAEVHREHPEVIFLSEAFSTPKVMKLLAKLGFTQSYTSFTWLNHANELREYMQELCYSGMQEYLRPNFFTNTPDILPKILQTGGMPAFQMRLVLAATLSPSYGIYSGFELCENSALPDSEEYLNSEKYEIHVRDWNQPGNINDLITKVNRIRAENVALHRLDNIQFFVSDNHCLLVYGKRHGDNILLIVVNLDPFNPHHGTVTIPPHFLGVPLYGRYEVIDLLSDVLYDWGEHNYVRLDPQMQVAHILEVHRPR
jgi:starch synthase (maltosyl-transferring)